MATLIVVERGASRTFQHFQATGVQAFGRDVELIWDRRRGDRRRREASAAVERRVGDRREADPEPEPLLLDEARRMERRERPERRMPERRQAERRRRAPETWRTLGFLLARLDRPPHQAPDEIVR